MSRSVFLKEKVRLVAFDLNHMKILFHEMKLGTRVMALCLYESMLVFCMY